jgi:hypothetical protein
MIASGVHLESGNPKSIAVFVQGSILQNSIFGGKNFEQVLSCLG